MRCRDGTSCSLCIPCLACTLPSLHLVSLGFGDAIPTSLHNLGNVKNIMHKLDIPTTYMYVCTDNRRAVTTKYTSRILSIVGERERASCNNQMFILNESLAWFIEDLMNVAIFAKAAKVQCWITSCNVELF